MALNIFSLGSLVAVCDVKRHSLAIFQAATTVAANRPEVDENLFSVIFGDEAESLGYVEPFHLTFFSVGVPGVLSASGGAGAGT